MPNPLVPDSGRQITSLLLPGALMMLILLLILGCATKKNVQGGGNYDLPAMMQGSFNSAAQAARDSNYYSVDLHMKAIWPERNTDENAYLYVEQALSAYPDRPYRQRVYRIYKVDASHWASEVFELPDADAMVGAWQKPSVFEALSPDSLSLREGCTVWLESVAGGFAGATSERSCPSDLRGAAYASSQVMIYPDSIVSWDRGYDSLGQQVWGAEAGGYVFVRQAVVPAE